jgi:hypothetical protein
MFISQTNFEPVGTRTRKILEQWAMNKVIEYSKTHHLKCDIDEETEI